MRGALGRIRRGYKPLLPVFANFVAKFGQSSKNKQESGKGQGKNLEGVWLGRKERRMAEGRKGVGQELGKGSKTDKAYLARRPG